MKTYSAYIVYEDGSTQKVSDIHTIQHFDQAVVITPVEEYMNDKLILGNIVGLFGDQQSLVIRKGKYRSIQFTLE